MFVIEFLVFIQSKTIITYKDLENRNAHEICADYQKNYVWTKSEPCYVSGQGCEYGQHSKDDIDATTRRINFFRTLVGLAKCYTSNDDTNLEYVNQASLVSSKNHIQTHDLDNTSLTCWNEKAQYGCRNSNLAMTTASTFCSADTIPLYINDETVPSCGHRRWILNPPFAEVAAGVAESNSALLVMGSANRNNTYIPSVIAYPPPGPIPSDVVYTHWSFSRQYNPATQSTHNMPQDSKVELVCNGKTIPVTPTIEEENLAMYPGAVLFDGGKLASGSMCSVKISSDSLDTEWQYNVYAIKCVDGKAEDIPDGANVDGSPKKGLSGGAVAAIVIVVIVVVIVAVYGVFIFVKKRQESPSVHAEA